MTGSELHSTPRRPDRSEGAIAILIVDDCRLYREGLAAMVAHGMGIARVLMAADRAEMERCLANNRPDIVLVNLATSGSADLLVDVRAHDPDAGIIVIGASDDEEQVFLCAEIGVSGYLLRSEPAEQLFRLVQAVLDGITLCSPKVTATLLRRLPSGPARRSRVRTTLTIREHQVAALIDEGLSNKEIASRLSIEVRTVKNHVHNILEKLRVSRRGEAAAALRRGTTIAAAGSD